MIVQFYHCYSVFKKNMLYYVDMLMKRCCSLKIVNIPISFLSFKRYSFRMISHELLFHTGNRILEYKKALQTRRMYCLLSLINYTNSLLFVSLMFSQLDLLVEVLFCLSSCLIGISLTALYIKLPPLMLPDKCYKVILSMCALFYSIQDVDTGLEMSGWRLIWVSTAAILQFYEVYVLLNAISHIRRRMEQINQQMPPPTYVQVASLFQEEGRLSHSSDLILDISDVDKGKGGISNTKLLESPRSETPPPPYELAVERLRSQR